MAYSQAQEFFIGHLRGMLTMYYHKVAGSDYDGIAKLGDDELWQDLRLGINYFNSYPPVMTTYSFEDLYKNSRNYSDPTAPESETAESAMITPVMMCALFFVGMRLQFFEAGKHFEYNDNGISIMRKKQADYANIVGGSVLAYLSAQLGLIKKSFKMQLIKPKGLFSGGVGFPRSLTRGLRGTRLGWGG
jgi:hypothetical protein